MQRPALVHVVIVLRSPMAVAQRMIPIGAARAASYGA